MQIAVSDSLKDFVESQVAKGGFRDASEYVQSLLEDACLAQERARLEALALEGIADIEKGNAAEMTAEEWKEMREQYLERATKRNGS
jgi:antitoxin ParD1/3/4